MDIITESNINTRYLEAEADKLFGKYETKHGDDYNTDSIELVINKCLYAKQTLYDLFKKSKFWNNEQMSLSFVHEFQTTYDTNTFDYVKIWMKRHEAWKYESVQISVQKHYLGDSNVNVVDADNIRSDDIYDLRESNKHFDKFLCVLDSTPCDRFLSEETAKAINEYVPELKAHKGEKTVKFLCRVAHWYKLDNIKDIHTITAHDGDREKDFGWNYQKVRLGEALAPKTYKQRVYISINPLDFWSMSIGHKWTSCYSIDCSNLLGNSQYEYQGCYSAGTTAYALDGTSVIMYTLPADYNGDTPWQEQKLRRCVFNIIDDGTYNKFTMGVLYPDGRAGGCNDGEASLVKQWRNIMQKVVADCLGVKNQWTYSYNNVSAEAENDYDDGYIDIFHDGRYINTSYLGVKGTPHNAARIHIGECPICISCGREFETDEGPDNVMCEECRNGYDYEICARCGDRIDTEHDSYIYCEDNDSYYCDVECASNDGVEYCSDDGEYHDRNNWVYCDYSTCCLHEDYVRMDDGTIYRDYVDAQDDGYVPCEEGWYREEDTCYCVDDKLCHYIDYCYEGSDGNYYYSEAARDEADEANESENIKFMVEIDRKEAI